MTRLQLSNARRSLQSLQTRQSREHALRHVLNLIALEVAALSHISTPNMQPTIGYWANSTQKATLLGLHCHCHRHSSLPIAARAAHAQYGSYRRYSSRQPRQALVCAVYGRAGACAAIRACARHSTKHAACNYCNHRAPSDATQRGGHAVGHACGILSLVSSAGTCSQHSVMTRRTHTDQEGVSSDAPHDVCFKQCLNRIERQIS